MTSPPIRSRQDTTACERGYDADFVAETFAHGRDASGQSEVEEHIRSCPACAGTARDWELIRGAWRAGRERDDHFARSASERRLAARLPRSRGVPWPLALAATALAALFTGWWVSPPSAGHPHAPVGLAAAPRDAEALPGAARVRSAPSAAGDSPPAVGLGAPPKGPGPAPAVRHALVAVRGCAGCGIDFAAGDRLAESREVRVPGGATLALNWAVDESLLDAQSSVDVDGPAVVRAQDSEAGVALVLESGAARARAGDRAEVVTRLARTYGSDAAWSVSVQGGKTRISVQRGQVEVTTPTQHAVLASGEAVFALVDGRLAPAVEAEREPGATALAVHRVPEAAARDADGEAAVSRDDERWRSARTALRAGDRDRAADDLRALAQSAGDRALRDRASFELAEIELAEGKADDAHMLLWPLLDALDASLAGDAAFLLARTSSTSGERASVLARYLAKPRPSPYRQQAMVERAGALLASGDEAGGRAIIRTLRAEPTLPPVAEAALVRIERSLQGAGREEH
jgi:hypothetical protein